MECCVKGTIPAFDSLTDVAVSPGDFSELIGYVRRNIVYGRRIVLMGPYTYEVSKIGVTCFLYRRDIVMDDAL